MTGPTFCTHCKRMRSLTCRRCLDRARGMVSLGWLYVIAFVLLGFTASAHADSYRVHCGEHLTQAHHLDHYVSDWWLPIPYATESACDDGAQWWVDHNYHGGVLPDGSRVLVQCWCERVKA